MDENQIIDTASKSSIVHTIIQKRSDDITKKYSPTLAGYAKAVQDSDIGKAIIALNDALQKFRPANVNPNETRIIAEEPSEPYEVSEGNILFYMPLREVTERAVAFMQNPLENDCPLEPVITPYSNLIRHKYDFSSPSLDRLATITQRIDKLTTEDASLATAPDKERNLQILKAAAKALAKTLKDKWQTDLYEEAITEKQNYQFDQMAIFKASYKLKPFPKIKLVARAVRDSALGQAITALNDVLQEVRPKDVSPIITEAQEPGMMEHGNNNEALYFKPFREMTERAVRLMSDTPALSHQVPECVTYVTENWFKSKLEQSKPLLWNLEIMLLMIKGTQPEDLHLPEHIDPQSYLQRLKAAGAELQEVMAQSIGTAEYQALYRIVEKYEARQAAKNPQQDIKVPQSPRTAVEKIQDTAKRLRDPYYVQVKKQQASRQGTRKDL